MTAVQAPKSGLVRSAGHAILSTVRAEAVFDMRDLYGLSATRIRSGFADAVKSLLAGY